MNKIILFLIAILLTLPIYAQKVRSNIDIGPLRCDFPNKKDGIRYCLPYSVQTRLDSFFQFQKSTNDNFSKKKIIIIMDYEGGKYNLTGHFLNGPKSGDLDALIRRSNRYVIIEGMKVPIIFNADFDFSFLNMAISGYNFYLEFLGKRFTQGQITTWEAR